MNSEAHGCYLYQKAEKQTEMDSQGVSNEPFSIVGDTDVIHVWRYSELTNNH